MPKSNLLQGVNYSIVDNDPAEREKVSLVIPCYNESANIEKHILAICYQQQAISELGYDSEIIVVNDGSTDNTRHTLGAIPNIKVVHHLYNLGNGAAVKSGIRAATGKYVLLIDADGQHPPEEITGLLKCLADGYDMVVASRSSQCSTAKFRNVGNFMLKKFAGLLVEREITDLTSGFRVVRRDLLLKYLKLFPNKYSYPTTITMCLLKAGYFVHFKEMHTIGKRATGKSHIRPFQDGLAFINIMFRITMLFNPQKVFGTVALLMLLLGAAMGCFQLITRGGLFGSSLLLLIISTYTFLFGLLADQVSAIRREI
ncbi:MAG: glycosyltransferase family 2 protein [Deltaproteobacteria bacterium]|nr:glycosyltransferase family 2 protein [Deltaproteobacteria bacterium]